MSRYFIEVSYKGTNYSGFQVQANANSIQGEVENCLRIFYKCTFELTGSSRTDAGVHALHNVLHFDSEERPYQDAVYHLNAILPRDIVIRSIYQVMPEAHCRFDALSRTYCYSLYNRKDPFLDDRAYFFPYTNLDIGKLEEAASIILEYEDFTSFSKRNTQVNNFTCTITESCWKREEGKLIYQVTGNRFLRGMVRGLVGTMLRVGTGKLSMAEFHGVIRSKDCGKVDFSVPAHGLFLVRVNYAEELGNNR